MGDLGFTVGWDFVVDLPHCYFDLTQGFGKKGSGGGSVALLKRFPPTLLGVICGSISLADSARISLPVLSLPAQTEARVIVGLI